MATVFRRLGRPFQLAKFEGGAASVPAEIFMNAVTTAANRCIIGFASGIS